LLRLPAGNRRKGVDWPFDGEIHIRPPPQNGSELIHASLFGASQQHPQDFQHLNSPAEKKLFARDRGFYFQNLEGARLTSFAEEAKRSGKESSFLERLSLRDSASITQLKGGADSCLMMTTAFQVKLLLLFSLLPLPSIEISRRNKTIFIISLLVADYKAGL
jgi:hypothetical protein